MGHQPLRVLVGSLAPGVLPSTQPAKMPTGTILLDLGPEHPSQAGLIELRLWTEDDVITTAGSWSAQCIEARRSSSRSATTGRS